MDFCITCCAARAYLVQNARFPPDLLPVFDICHVLSIYLLIYLLAYLLIYLYLYIYLYHIYIYMILYLYIAISDVVVKLDARSNGDMSPVLPASFGLKGNSCAMTAASRRAQCCWRWWNLYPVTVLDTKYWSLRDRI